MFFNCCYERYMLHEWLESMLRKHGTKQAQLARVLTEDLGRSIDRAAVNKMMKPGKNGKRRTITADELLVMESLFGEVAPNPNADQTKVTSTRTVKVKAHVQAGNWAETWEWEETDFYDVPIPVDPALQQFALFGAETRGPSMNKRYPEGSVLVFTDIVETGEEIEVGRRYVVERRRGDGQGELTVKTLWLDENEHPWLIPESDDPRFQDAIGINGDNEDETIRIVGRVRYAVIKE